MGPQTCCCYQQLHMLMGSNPITESGLNYDTSGGPGMEFGVPQRKRATERRKWAMSRGPRKFFLTAWSSSPYTWNWSPPCPSLSPLDHAVQRQCQWGREEQKEKKCKQDVILQHVAWNEAEHTQLTKDTAQWCHRTAQWRQSQAELQQRMLDLQQQQVEKHSEAAAKLITVVMERMEVLRSRLQLQKDSQHSSAGADTCCPESSEERSPTHCCCGP